jgi:hypothetical protein
LTNDFCFVVAGSSSLGKQHQELSMKVDPMRRSASCAYVRSAVLVAVALPFVLSAKPTSAETRGYVISWFATAVNTRDFAGDCPDTAKHIDKGAAEDGPRRRDVALVDGKPVPTSSYPAAVQKDPAIETIQGKYAYGFDLGGPAANKFIDPQTHEKVDNQIWRAIGCHSNFAQRPPPEMPYSEALGWSALLDTSPGWVMQISGADLNKDGPVTVTLDRTLRHVERDAQGGVRNNVTYTIDPAPRSHNVLTGDIKKGLLGINSGDIYMVADLPFYTQVDLTNAHMRMRTESDGKLLGYWGGHTDWQAWMYLYTARPAAADPVGYYWALQKLADADPDPATGQNRRISTTWRMQAVPAFLAQVDGTVIANASPEPLGGVVQQTAAASGTSSPANPSRK